MKNQGKIIIGAGGLLIAVIVIVVVLMGSGGDKKQYEKHMDLAQQYMDELQYEQAIAECEAAIAIDPDNAEAHEALAKIYMALENDEATVGSQNQDAAQTDSKEPETSQRDVPEEGDSVIPEKTEEEGVSGEDDASNEELPDGSGAVTILVTWDDCYDDGSLAELEVGLTGTLDDGTELSFNEEGKAFDVDGALAAEIETVVSEMQGSCRVTLYRTDGRYDLEVVDGIGYAVYNTNGLPDSVEITLEDAEGNRTLLDVESAMYRSYTGIWFFGIGIDHGMTVDYEMQEE